MSSICNASSSGHRRNPDFPRKIRLGFSRNKNTHTEGNLKDVEPFFSKSALPSLSGSASPRFQDAATTSPKEREIVELFRDVQVQLRDRAVLKEETKVEDSVIPSLSRPVSNFRRRSPVPQFKYDLILSGKDTVKMKSESTPEPGLELKLETKSEPLVTSEAFLTNGIVSDKVSYDEFETSEDEGIANEVDDSEEEKATERNDLSEMKLPELRAVAKCRGLKGLSKLKKHELFELLTSNGTV